MKKVFFAVYLLLFPLCAYAQEDASAEYFVESVSIDPTLYNTQHIYMQDDPRLKNRVFFINVSQLTSDTATGVCRKKNSKNIMLGKWLATTFPAHMFHSSDNFPVRDPADFNVPYSKKTLVSSLGYNCDDRKEKKINRPVQVTLPNKKLLLTWKGDGVLLILRKIKPGEKIPPSFKCSQNNTETEKAICDSNVLGGWDRSMLEALQKAIRGTPEADNEVDHFQLSASQVNDIINFQKKWLIERNKCKDDKACIAQQYNDQVDTMYDIALSGGYIPKPQTEEEKRQIEEDMLYFSKLTKKKK